VRLWAISGDRLEAVPEGTLASEEQLEVWLEREIGERAAQALQKRLRDSSTVHCPSR
jgi:hypothetical protein